MWLLVISAAFVGFLHSLSPGHWLPVVVLSKTRKWKLKRALIGALTLALGHIVMTNIIAVIAGTVEQKVFSRVFENPEKLEQQINFVFGSGLILFGLVYAFYSYRNHAFCHHDEHGHHGPEVPHAAKKRTRSDFWFLFSIGMNPCVAALPIFLTAQMQSSYVFSMALLGFSLAVATALILATFLSFQGAKYFDHPWLEHYGDSITGIGIAVTGGILVLLHALGWG